MVQASGVGVAACTTDKMTEEVEHRLVAGGGEPFGVPLDAEDGVFGVLHRLVDAVGRLGRGDETGGQVADGLVVERVDGDGCGTRRGVEPHRTLQFGIWGGEGDGLRDDVARFRLTMWQYGAWKLRGKVLVERAAKGYVDELMAATNAEDGEAALVGQADQLQLAGVADRIDVFERRVRRLAKQIGTDVAAASQEQAVETFDNRGEDAQLGRGGHEYGGATCQNDRLEIGVGEHLFAVSAVDRNADAWVCGGGSVDG